METGYKVADLMTTAPISGNPDMSLEDCAKILREKRVGTILIKENNELVGILSERDIVRTVVANASEYIKEGKNSTNIPVKEIMIKDIITIEPQLDIFQALNKMKEFDIRHLPVVYKGELLGILTMKDVLKFEPELFELIVEKLSIREEARKLKSYEVDDF